MTDCGNYAPSYSRRDFLTRTSLGFGAASLSLLSSDDVRADESPGRGAGLLSGTHFPAKAKRVIYLLQSGAPTQIETFDYKPQLTEMMGQELPASVTAGSSG